MCVEYFWDCCFGNRQDARTPLLVSQEKPYPTRALEGLSHFPHAIPSSTASLSQFPRTDLEHRSNSIVSIAVRSVEEHLGSTPLHWAARNGDVAEARRLVSEGIEVNTLDSKFDMPFDLAVRGEQKDFFHSLLGTSKRLSKVSHTPTQDVDGYCLRLAKKENLIEEQIFYLLKIGDRFIQDKLFLIGAKILNCALALCLENKPNLILENYLYAKLAVLEYLFLKQKDVAVFFNRDRIRHLIAYRSRLKAIRLECEQAQKQSQPIQSILSDLTEAFKIILTSLISDAQQILGSPPVRWAAIGMGSMSRSEMCPYSDVEFAFLLAEATPEALKYFRTLSQLLELQIINLGETAFPVFGEHSPSPIPNGFCLDSGGNTPLGAQGLYELIGTPQQIAQFENALWIERNIILANALSTVSYVCGDQQLVRDYRQEQKKVLDQENLSLFKDNRSQLALCLLEKHLEEFRPDLSKEKAQVRAFGIKKELYRPFQEILGCLALYYRLEAKNTFDRIDELIKMAVLSPEGGKSLQTAIAQVLSLRLETHLFYKDEKEFLCYPEKDKPQDESLLYFSEKYIKLLHEIYKALIPFHVASKSFFLTKSKEVLQNSVFYDEGLLAYGTALEKTQCYEQAQKAFQEAAALNPDDMEAYLKLGEIESRLGNKESELKYYETALEIGIRKYGENHPSLITCYHNIGEVLFQKNEYRTALKYLKKGFQIGIQKFGEQNIHIALVYNVMAMCYGKVGKTQKAVLCYQKALKILDSIYDDAHEHIATAYFNLAEHFYALDDFDHSLEAHQKVLAINLKLYHKEHLVVAKNHQSIALSLSNLRRYTEALEHINTCLRIRRQHYGHEHLLVLESLDNVWKIKINAGNFKEALWECKESFLMHCRLCPQEQLKTTDYLNNLIKLLDRQSDVKLVHQVIQEVFLQAEKLLGSRHLLVEELQLMQRLKK